LIYNLEEGARTTEPNFYQLLGVTPEAEQRTLKLAFRQFARKHHPDKISRYRTGEGSEDLFMVVRDAFEALKDPVVRFAYDRLVVLNA
jgi:DnaJ-class molecular chaperone